MRESLPRRAVRSATRRLQRRVFPPAPQISAPSGRLDPEGDGPTLVIPVGPTFHQDMPHSMTIIRLGLARAFETLGIPYVIVDLRELHTRLSSLHQPFCILFGADYAEIGTRALTALRSVPHAVWVNPWFENSDAFFAEHGLNASIWDWSDAHRRRILEAEPKFVYTATVDSGLDFFECWEQRGVPVRSIPLACDTTVYNPEAEHVPEFDDIQLAFVGGWWESKGRQIDRYLRPFEDRLVVYGHNEWPYRGYRGMLLPREREASLYKQALVSPTINEPTVDLLRGQINERAFKVLGSGGVTVTDAVSAYRELFTDDELLVPDGAAQFADMVSELLADPDLRSRYRAAGHRAVVERHTYVHRARTILDGLGLSASGH